MRYPSAIWIFLASLPGALAGDMRHEETVVRTTYAKLSYAVELNTVYRVVLANPKIDPGEFTKQLDLRGLRFQLSDFTFGNLADIAGAKYTDVLPPYDGNGQDLIHTSVATENYSEVGGATASMETATAEWGPPPNGRTPDWTAGQMIPVLEREIGVSQLLRYCSFTVTATLAGRSRTYKASFLFGRSGRAAAVDPVTGTDGNNLQYFSSHSVYPDVLLRTRMGEIPVIRSFLEANQRSGNSCKSGEACCDAETLLCGVFSADLAERRP